MAADPNFLRLSKGAYSLHCFHPDKEQLVRAPQPKKRKLDDLGEFIRLRRHGDLRPSADPEAIGAKGVASGEFTG